MQRMNPQLKALVIGYRDANPTEDGELQHLRDMAERSRLALAEAQGDLAAAWVREREAALEVKRAKAARIRLEGMVQQAEAQRHAICAELDAMEWQAEVDLLAENAERVAASFLMTPKQMKAEIDRQTAVLVAQRAA